jgi:hypothetical protein
MQTGSSDSEISLAVNLEKLVMSVPNGGTESCSESQISVQVSFALIGRFFLVYIHSRLSQQLLKAHSANRKPEQAF